MIDYITFYISRDQQIHQETDSSFAALSRKKHQVQKYLSLKNQEKHAINISIYHKNKLGVYRFAFI